MGFEEKFPLKSVAIGYITFAVVCFVALVMLVKAAGWHGVAQLREDWVLLSDSGNFLIAGVCLCTALALTTWFFRAIPRVGQYCLAIIALAIPGYLIVENVRSWLELRSGGLDFEVETWGAMIWLPVLSSNFIFFGFLLLGGRLFFELLPYSKSPNGDADSGGVR